MSEDFEEDRQAQLKGKSVPHFSVPDGKRFRRITFPCLLYSLFLSLTFILLQVRHRNQSHNDQLRPVKRTCLRRRELCALKTQLAHPTFPIARVSITSSFYDTFAGATCFRQATAFQLQVITQRHSCHKKMTRNSFCAHEVTSN